MDGIPAPDFGDLVIQVFDSSSDTTQRRKERAQGGLLHNKSSNKYTNIKTKVQSQNKDLELVNVDPNVKSSHRGALLYTFEDIEAVIKMIIAGRSSTMRQVSRTHRVALNWLFDRINFDPKIQIRNMDKKHQLADILT